MNELVQLDVSFEYAPRVYVYKREKSWAWKFKLPTGAWFYGTAGKTKAAAERNARKKEQELAKGYFQQAEINKIHDTSGKFHTFETAIEEYIDSLRAEGASPNYYERLEMQLLASARYFVEEKNVSLVHKLTEDHAYAFRKMLLHRVQDEEISRPSAFRALNDTKRLFKWLKRRKLIRSNPWVDIDAIPVPKEQKARTTTPPADIIPKLMNAKYEHRYEFPIKEFAYGLFRTGARNEELLFLEVNDVDWETGVWHIKSKQCPTQHGMKWRPKNGKSRQTVIPRDVLEVLKPLVDRVKKHKVVGYTPGVEGEWVPKPAGFLFTMLDRKLSNEGGVPVYRRVNTVRNSWNELFLAAGLADVIVNPNQSQKAKDKLIRAKYTRHDMRRGFNVFAREAGMSLDERALILGHGRDVNENHYCGKPGIDTERIAELLNFPIQKQA